MKKLTKFTLIFLITLLILCLGVFVFYKFYLKPKTIIPTAISKLKVAEKFDQNIIDSIVLYTKNNVRNSACISIAIIDSGKTYFYGFNREKNQLYTHENSDSLFQIGSISKVFTATILSNLILENKINPNETIEKYLGFELKNHLKLSFAQLVNHTSGLNRMPEGLISNMMSDFDQPYKNYTNEWIENYLKNDIEIKPSKKGTYEYSNLGAAILGYTMAQSQGKTYESLLDQYVLKKYKLQHTFLYKSEDAKRLVKSIDIIDSVTTNWVLNSFNPAGGIVSNINDMSLFALANMDSTHSDLIQMHKTTAKIDSSLSIGMAWHIISAKNKHTYLFHNGATSNFNSSMAIDYNTKKAVIVLSNSNYVDTKGNLDKLVLGILNYLNR